MLLDILNAHAETMGADYSVYVTPDLEEVWDDFDTEAREALEAVCFDIETFEDDTTHDLTALVYHTLAGAGVGLWEDEHLAYWGEPASAERHVQWLRERLSEWADRAGSGKINEALTECVESQAPPMLMGIEICGATVDDSDLGLAGGLIEPGEDVTLALTANENGDQPQSSPLGWLNSARIHAEPDQDRVTVMISVGDTRGAFCMTVERVNGELRLSVPHPDQSLPHAPLSPLASVGYYKVGG